MKKIPKIRIGRSIIGTNQPVFIIAEAGVNHNGQLSTAKKLVDAAKIAGADAVKFQTFDTDELTTKDTGMPAYQIRNTGRRESQYDMVRRLELSASDFGEIARYACKRGIIFISAPHSGFHSVDLLQKLHVPAFKFGSADLNNFPVLAYAARFKKPMIISTGMADEKGVRDAVSCIRKAGNNKIVVFQCTTDYPSRLEDVNLRAMPVMGEKFGVVVGYSDHTTGNEAAIAAVALGAQVLEKHITLDNAMQGPDHAASANPRNFVAYVRAVRDTEKLLGSAKKVIAPSARRYMPFVLKSVVARMPVRKGEEFTGKNLAIKRPARGLPPRFFFQILGKHARRDIMRDEYIRKSDYA